MKTIFDLLRERFAAPTYAYLEEVRNGTGYSRRTVRTADALAFCTWPSRGLELHGIEVKIARGDWLKERDDPAKAEEIAKYCDRWWLAVEDESIVKEGELPANWGLLVKKGEKLICKKDAPKLKAKAIDRLLLASILRNVTDRYIPRSSVEPETQRRIAEARDSEEKVWKTSAERLEAEVARLLKVISDFEGASGVQLNAARWSDGRRDNGKIGEAVRFVLDGGVKTHESRLEWLAREAEGIAITARGALAAARAADGGGAAPDFVDVDDLTARAARAASEGA